MKTKENVWTKEELSILNNCVSISSKKKEAFQQAAKELNRSASACAWKFFSSNKVTKQSKTVKAKDLEVQSPNVLTSILGNLSKLSPTEVIFTKDTIMIRL